MGRVAALIRIGGTIRVVLWIVAFVEAAIDLAYEPAPVLLRDAVGIPLEQVNDVVGAPVQLLKPAYRMVKLVGSFAGLGSILDQVFQIVWKQIPFGLTRAFVAMPVRVPAAIRFALGCRECFPQLLGGVDRAGIFENPCRGYLDSTALLLGQVRVVRCTADPVRLHGIARVVVTAKRTHASANLGRITDRQPFGEQDVMSVPRRRFGDQRCGYGQLRDLARIGIVILRQAEDLDRVRRLPAYGWWEIGPHGSEFNIGVVPGSCVLAGACRHAVNVVWREPAGHPQLVI